MVTGCLAEQDRDVMQRRAPTSTPYSEPKSCDSLAISSKRGPCIRAKRARFEKPTAATACCGLQWAARPTVSRTLSPHLRAFVTVQRGCSYYCTFCIVPHVRGRFDHRPQGDIFAEARHQIGRGAREIMLVGQTVNAWRDPAGGGDFGDLCRAVASLPGFERLTFISPHPKDFTEKFSMTSRKFRRSILESTCRFSRPATPSCVA